MYSSRSTVILSGGPYIPREVNSVLNTAGVSLAASAISAATSSAPSAIAGGRLRSSSSSSSASLPPTSCPVLDGDRDREAPGTSTSLLFTYSTSQVEGNVVLIPKTTPVNEPPFLFPIRSCHHHTTSHVAYPSIQRTNVFWLYNTASASWHIVLLPQ